MKVIDLCEGYGGAGCLKRYYMENNIEDFQIHSFGLCLASGDIRDDRLKYLREFYEDENLSITFVEKVFESITEDSVVRIWSSKSNDDDYMLLLFLCNKLRGKKCKLSVIFSDTYNKYMTSIDAAGYKEIAPLLKCEHELSSEEIAEYACKWDELVNINSELRVLENGEIKCKKYEDYYDTILNVLRNKGNCTRSCLCGECMAARVINDAGSLLYAYLIDKLIDLDKIKIVENAEKKYLSIIEVV